MPLCCWYLLMILLPCRAAAAARRVCLFMMIFDAYAVYFRRLPMLSFISFADLIISRHFFRHFHSSFIIIAILMMLSDTMLSISWFFVDFYWRLSFLYFYWFCFSFSPSLSPRFHDYLFSFLHFPWFRHDAFAFAFHAALMLFDDAIIARYARLADAYPRRDTSFTSISMRFRHAADAAFSFSLMSLFRDDDDDGAISIRFFFYMFAATDAFSPLSSILFFARRFRADAAIILCFCALSLHDILTCCCHTSAIFMPRAFCCANADLRLRSYDFRRVCRAFIAYRADAAFRLLFLLIFFFTLTSPLMIIIRLLSSIFFLSIFSCLMPMPFFFTLILMLFDAPRHALFSWCFLPFSMPAFAIFFFLFSSAIFFDFDALSSFLISMPRCLMMLFFFDFDVFFILFAFWHWYFHADVTFDFVRPCRRFVYARCFAFSFSLPSIISSLRHLSFALFDFSPCTSFAFAVFAIFDDALPIFHLIFFFHFFRWCLYFHFAIFFSLPLCPLIWYAFFDADVLLIPDADIFFLSISLSIISFWYLMISSASPFLFIDFADFDAAYLSTLTPLFSMLALIFRLIISAWFRCR